MRTPEWKQLRRQASDGVAAVQARFADTTQELHGVVAFVAPDLWLWMPQEATESFAVRTLSGVTVVDDGRVLLRDAPARFVSSGRLRRMLGVGGESWDWPLAVDLLEPCQSGGRSAWRARWDGREAVIDADTGIVLALRAGSHELRLDVVSTNAKEVDRFIERLLTQVPVHEVVKNGTAFADRFPGEDGRPAYVTAHHEVSLSGRIVAWQDAPRLGSMAEGIAWGRQRAERVKVRYDANRDDYTELPGT